MFSIEHERISNTDFPWVIRRDEQFLTSFENEQIGRASCRVRV